MYAMPQSLGEASFVLYNADNIMPCGPFSHSAGKGRCVMARVVMQFVFFFYRPVFFILAALDTAVLGVIVIIISYFDPGGNVVHYIGRVWSRANLLLSGVRMRVYGREHIRKGQPYVVMINHQSHYDVWAAIGYLPLQLRWVMKMELRGIPIFGLGCERMGHIYIERRDPEKAHRSLAVAGEKIRSGASVVFFPEGTRSRDGRLQEFKKGGFVIALSAGVPILPVTVNGGRKILPKGSVMVRPGVMEIIIHPPVDVSEYTAADKGPLITKVREIIESALVV